MSAPPDLGNGWAALVDDTPTIQLWPDPRQLATTSERRAGPAPGSVLRSRYVLEEVIGRGGTSMIFRAQDLHRALPQDTAANFVAVKLLRLEQRADPLALMRLKREFRQMQRLSHCGIVRVFDLDCDGDVWFISMELVTGRTVQTWMATPRSYEHALKIIGTCCGALEHAHALGTLHGDLKPTNVMVTDDGTAKLIDFGSTSSSGGLVADGSGSSLAATPLYASPQILAGKSAERRDDVFSLACLSYSILSGGRHPFGGHPSLEDGRAKLAPTYERAIPAELFEVIERGLSAERARRPASVSEFLHDLTDADQRRRADTTSAATPARDPIDPVRHPASIMHTVDKASRSTASILFKKIRLGARSLTGANRTAIAPAPHATTGAGTGGGRGFSRRAQPIVRPIALLFTIVGAVVLFRLRTHRDVIPAAELAPKASATFPELMTAVRAQTVVFPETRLLSADSGVISFAAPTAQAGAQQALVASPVKPPQASRPLPHNSGVISFEAPTVQASTRQPLVAISVKRLQGTRSSGAFVWRVERGTARPGVDYQRVDPQIVRFIEGQAVRTLFIPLINNPSTGPPRGPRNFTVVLQQVAGGPELGRFARVTVAIDPPPTSSSFGAHGTRAEE